jgi:hypothetical protein
MKIEAKQRLQATKSYDSDASTAAQGTAAAKKEIKEGWIDKDEVKGWSLKEITQHLAQSIGASPDYAAAYLKEACTHFKLPFPKG